MEIDRKTLAQQAHALAEGLMGPGKPAQEGHFMSVWDWYQGVALFGLYTYYRQTREQRVWDYLIGWFDAQMQRGLPEKNVNSMCPLLTLSFLYEDTGNEAYLEVCREWLDYAMTSLPRTPEGGFQHKTIDSDNYCQLWDDTLYMTVLFVARMATLLNDDRYLQESIRQFLVHLKYLTDLKTGLFFHGWNFDGCHHFGEALWGHGNAWYTAGLVDYLDLAKVPEGVRMVLLSALERQAQALEKYQDSDGMWHTLVNLPESSYPESSATAGFSYGLLKAVRLQYLPKRFQALGQKGLAAILARIDDHGLLQQVSMGTVVGKDLDDYRRVPQGPQPYGQSMALLLLLEALKWAD